MLKIGIIGGGFVGSATYLLNCKDVECRIYDKDESKCVPKGTTLEDLQDRDIIFICVPTPMLKDGSCYTKIVETVLNDIIQLESKAQIVVRSTIPVGSCKKWGVHFMPEFLTEANWKNDFYNCDNWIIGVNQDCKDYMDFYVKFSELINHAYMNECIKSNQIRCVTTEEAETIKYFRNCFLATKISFCNEFYRFCNAKGISYDKVSEIACLDNRITSYHSKVPGPDGSTGFSGHCLPKDLNSMIYQMYNSDVKPIILQSVKIRNEDIDRVDKDWEKDKGRAVIN